MILPPWARGDVVPVKTFRSVWWVIVSNLLASVYNIVFDDVDRDVDFRWR